MKRVPALAVSRARLKEINRRILRLLARRNVVVKQVALRKAIEGIPIVRPGVERKCFADIRAQAESLGLDPQYACAVFQLMLGQAYKVEITHLQKGDSQ